MDKQLREKYKKASEHPEERMFQMGEAEEILSINERVIRKYEYNKVIYIPKDARGYRSFSFNDLRYVKACGKLVEMGYNTKLLSILIGFLKKEKVEHQEFLEKLEQYAQRLTKSN